MRPTPVVEQAALPFTGPHRATIGAGVPDDVTTGSIRVGNCASA
ncbi:MAG: hypothetical protein ACJ8AI_34985 [Rhodopila sp.]